MLDIFSFSPRHFLNVHVNTRVNQTRQQDLKIKILQVRPYTGFIEFNEDYMVVF